MDDPTLAVVAVTGAVSAATLIYRSGNERRAQALLARTAHTFGLQIRGLGLLGKLDGTPMELVLDTRDNACITVLASDIDAPDDLVVRLDPNAPGSTIADGELDGHFRVSAHDEEAAAEWFAQRPMFVETLKKLAGSASDVCIAKGRLRIETLDWPTDFGEYVRLIRFLIDVSAEATLRRAGGGPATIPAVGRAIGGRFRFVPARLRQFTAMIVFALLVVLVIAP